jgi:quercetin dioxygenase-like cupin family protein
LTAAAGGAEVQLACQDLEATLAFFVEHLGFRIETIFPADAPREASLSGHGLRIRLAPGDGGAGLIRLPRPESSPEAVRETTAPNGTRVLWVDPDPPVDIPNLTPEWVVARVGDGPAPGVGRAGMVYRDLIPGRLGGRFIASHITVPQGGPLADWVHFHKIRLQLLACRRGWARLVYEDQGPPFVFAAGDVVLQPPRIRHRVLEASDGFEVVEVSCPALHETLADHDLILPTDRVTPERDFGGQVFLRHQGAVAPWRSDPATGFEVQDTGVSGATGGLARAVVLRPAGRGEARFPPQGGELLFGFLLDGSAVLDVQGGQTLGPGDAFVIPPHAPWGLSGCSPDLALLWVTVG